jgi:hypothetical protein
MAKRLFSAIVLGTLALGSLAGCYHAGKATGEAAQTTKEGAQEFKKGYEAGKAK